MMLDARRLAQWLCGKLKHVTPIRTLKLLEYSERQKPDFSAVTTKRCLSLYAIASAVLEPIGCSTNRCCYRRRWHWASPR
jgi:hypothetical protein